MEASSPSHTLGIPRAEPHQPGTGWWPRTSPTSSVRWRIVVFLLVGVMLASGPGVADALGRSSEPGNRAGVRRSRRGRRPGRAMQRLNATTPAAVELMKIAFPRDRRLASDIIWHRMHNRLVKEVEVRSSYKILRLPYHDLTLLSGLLA
jgi:hypothetical protein